MPVPTKPVASTWNINPLPPIEGIRPHPRLLVSDLVAVKARLAGTQAAAFQSFLVYCDSLYGTADRAHELAMDFALIWLTYPVAGATYAHTRADYGAFARTQLLTQSNWTHNFGWGIPFAYDWVNSLLSAADKTTLVNFFKTVDQAAGTGTTADNTPINDVFNSFTPTTRSAKLLYALAVVDDGIDDAWAQGVLDAYQRYFRDDRATTNLQRGVTWAQSLYGGSDSGFGQGIDYGYSYTLLPLVYAEESYRTAMGISKAAHYGTPDTDLFRYLPMFTSVSIIPDAFPRSGCPACPDGQNWLFSKNHEQYYWEFPQPATPAVRASLAAVMGLYATVDPSMAGLAKWLLAHRTGMVTDERRDVVPLTFLLGLDADSIPERSPSSLNLPLAQEHHRGWWTFRSSWGNSITEPFVMASAGRQYTGTMGLHGNDVQIYRKGPVVLRQGIGVHEFQQASYAGAMMVFPDRTIPYDQLYGGQNLGAARWFFNPLYNLSADWAIDSDGDFGGASRFLPAAIPGDAQYLFIDLTKQYDHPARTDYGNETRLTSYVRQMVYFTPVNPDTESVRIVLFDRPSVTNTKFEKNWRMSFAGVTTFVNGTVAAGPSRGPDGTARKTHSTDTTLLTAVNTRYGANSTLWFSPLLPTSRDVILVQGLVGTQLILEDPYGRPQIDTQTLANHEASSAPWRIEVVSTTGQLTDVFLNAIEVTDANGVQSPTQPVIGTNFVGARIGDRLAMFASLSDAETSGSFTVPAGVAKTLIAGLAPSASYVIAGQSVTSSAAGTVQLTGVTGGVAVQAN